VLMGSNLHGTRVDLQFRNMGICPQSNMLFESLTVQEHFYF